MGRLPINPIFMFSAPFSSYKKGSSVLVSSSEIRATHSIPESHFLEREADLFQFTKASSGGVPMVVVLAVVYWDEDVESTYNTHDRRRIFVKESVVTHDGLFNPLFVSQFQFCISYLGSVKFIFVHVFLFRCNLFMYDYIE